MKIKVEADSIFKIFGDNPKEALKLLKQGESKDAIFEATGDTIGVQVRSSW